jgi:CRISPR system Cascade subunit CasD
MDASYVVALWAKEDLVAPFTLEELGDALKRPRFVPYLGRKACPLAAPMCPLVMETASLKVAFDTVEFPGDGMLAQIPHDGSRSYYWEDLDSDSTGMVASMVYPRRDWPLSRARWQFAERNEFYFSESTQEVQG